MDQKFYQLSAQFAAQIISIKTCAVTQLIYHYDTLGSLSRTEVRSDVSAHKIDRFSFEVAPSRTRNVRSKSIPRLGA